MAFDVISFLHFCHRSISCEILHCNPSTSNKMARKQTLLVLEVMLSKVYNMQNKVPKSFMHGNSQWIIQRCNQMAKSAVCRLTGGPEGPGTILPRGCCLRQMWRKFILRQSALKTSLHDVKAPYSLRRYKPRNGEFYQVSQPTDLRTMCRVSRYKPMTK